MKYHISLLIVLVAVHLSCSSKHSDQAHQQTTPQADAGSTLILGMGHKAALEIIKDLGGQDSTPHLAVVGPNHEWPLHGLYWNLEQYNSIIEIAEQDGNIVGIWYWTAGDFSENKEHREVTRRSVKSLTFNRQARTVEIQAE